MDNFFSIVVVVRNNQFGLNKTLRSIFFQKDVKLEVLVIDGSDSPMNILGFSNQFIEIKYFFERDKGIYDAMNKGLNRATGKFIYFLNTDDSFFSNNTLIKVKTLISHDSERSDIYYGSIIQLFNNYSIKKTPLRIQHFYKSMIFSHQGAFYKRDVLILFPFSLKFKYSSDYEQFLRLFETNKKFKEILIEIAYCKSGGFTDQNLLSMKVEKMRIALNYFPNLKTYSYHFFNLLYELFRSPFVAIMPEPVVRDLRKLLKLY